MTVFSTESPTVHSSLVRRGLGLSCEQDLDQAMLVENIAKDRFSATTIPLDIKYPDDDQWKVLRIVRDHDLVATTTGVCTALWNISIGVKLWECDESAPNKLIFPNLKVLTRDGYVAKIYNNGSVSVIVNFFFNGEQTGTLSADGINLSSLRLINGHIFGIMSGLYKTVFNFCKWDHRGNLISQISLDEFKESDIVTTTASKDYFVLFAKSTSSTSAKAFVFNLHDSSSTSFNLTVFNTRRPSLFLLGDHLFMADENKIFSFNLASGKSEYEYQEKNVKNITDLTATEHHVFFKAYKTKGTDSPYGHFWSLNLLTNDLKYIIEISFNRRNGLPPQPSVVGNFLIICQGKTDRGCDLIERVVYDFKNQTIVSKTHYNDTEIFLVPTERSPSFQSVPILVYNTKSSENRILYVENFHRSGKGTPESNSELSREIGRVNTNPNS